MKLLYFLATVLFCVIGAQLGFRSALIFLICILGGYVSVLTAQHYHSFLAMHVESFLGRKPAHFFSLVLIVLVCFVPIGLAAVGLNNLFRDRLTRTMDITLGAMFGAVCGLLLMWTLFP
jgi:hypothetical protein